MENFEKSQSLNESEPTIVKVDGPQATGSSSESVRVNTESMEQFEKVQKMTTENETSTQLPQGTVPPTSIKDETGKGGGKNGPTTPLGFLREVVELIVVTLVLLIAIRWAFAEARYIPSSSMEPTLQIEDRILVEKLSGHFRKPYQRGDILVFYPPPSEMGGKDLSYDPRFVLGRLTGLPFLPYEPAFIKRVIGLPGDTLRVEKGVGVYINGQLLDESQYIKEKPAYDLRVLSDIGTTGRIPYPGRPEVKTQDLSKPIVIPPGKLFMMGDNRNNSQDSHVWGFLDQDRVIGRACLVFWRRLLPPNYPMNLESGY